MPGYSQTESLGAESVDTLLADLKPPSELTDTESADLLGEIYLCCFVFSFCVITYALACAFQGPEWNEDPPVTPMRSSRAGPFGIGAGALSLVGFCLGLLCLL
jgi:hypothetical protein